MTADNGTPDRYRDALERLYYAAWTLDLSDDHTLMEAQAAGEMVSCTRIPAVWADLKDALAAAEEALRDG